MKVLQYLIKTSSILVLIIFRQQSFPTEEKSLFRFHLMDETYTLDPIEIRGTSGSYLFHNLYRGLYRYHREKGLIPEGAKACYWKTNKKLDCELKHLYWSNGKPLLAKHYITAFQRVIGPNSKSSNQVLLSHLKGAKKIMESKASAESLGISILKKDQKEHLIFEFETPDPDFLYKLALPVLAPIYSINFPKREDASQLVTNGPYVIKSWNKGKSVTLTANTKYPFPTKNLPPDVQALFVDDDMTALTLYRTGTLTFLRRLPTHYIDEFKKRKDFYQIPMARFDYVGFGPRIRNHAKLRKALAISLNYKELGKILSALGRPGCPSLPPNYLHEIPCHSFSPNEAKSIIQEMKKQNQVPSKLVFQYSRMGGEDIQRQAEWFQHQWKKHLNLDVAIEPVEQGMLTQKILTSPGDIFRKGQSLDWPTCLSALETLVSHHPENYLKLNDSGYDKLIKKMSQLQFSSNLDNRALCSQAIKYLMDRHLMIPMGEIHFTMLIRPEFSGWQINELNQLDLTSLTVSK